LAVGEVHREDLSDVVIDADVAVEVVVGVMALEWFGSSVQNCIRSLTNSRGFSTWTKCPASAKRLNVWFGNSLLMVSRFSGFSNSFVKRWLRERAIQSVEALTVKNNILSLPLPTSDEECFTVVMSRLCK